MKSSDRTELLASLESIAALMTKWGLKMHDWSLLDGPAIKLDNNLFDSAPWRDHLNIYIKEYALPWRTVEQELTLPPVGSSALEQLLDLARRGNHVHLVPALRYYTAGFDRKPIILPAGERIEVATLRGCSQVWSYKSVEIIDRIDDFMGDLERIVEERLVRLRAALEIAKEPDIRKRIVLLKSGYEVLRNGGVEEAREKFRAAAGPAWQEIHKMD